jgi:hypothetical protein
MFSAIARRLFFHGNDTLTTMFGRDFGCLMKNH